MAGQCLPADIREKLPLAGKRDRIIAEALDGREDRGHPENVSLSRALKV
jgi:hypothetical protein